MKASIIDYIMVILWFLAAVLILAGVLKPSLEAVAFVVAVAMGRIHAERAISREDAS